MISGFFDSDYGFPYVWVRLGINGMPPQLVPFLIDTGASTTVVHAPDALRRLRMNATDLDPRTWPRERIRQSSGVGGAALHRVLDASYEFLADDGPLTISNATIDLGAFDAGSLPSLLGWDLLRRFRIELDAIRSTVTLTPHARRATG